MKNISNSILFYLEIYSVFKDEEQNNNQKKKYK